MFSILKFHQQEPDLAVDLGTAFLRAGLADGRHRSDAPSRVGSRTALRQGVIADTDAAAAVLERVFAGYHQQKQSDLHVLACAPSDATEEEQKALACVIQTAGANRVALVPEPVAALIGAGADLGSNGAYLVIDLGEGVFDCALVKERRLFSSVTWRGGCAALRATVVSRLREVLDLRISDAEAEAVLRRVGMEEWRDALMTIHGTAVPTALIHNALREKMDPVVALLLDFLRQLEPKICAEAIANGVEITGGGALIPGLAEYCARATHLPLHRAPHPLESVIHGACSLLGPATKLNLWDSLGSFWPAS